MIRRLAALMFATVIAPGCMVAEIGDPVALVDDVGEPDAAPPRVEPDAAPVPDATVAPDAIPPADALPCTEGELNTVDPTTGNCYMYFSAEVPWSVALSACAAISETTHLAVITSAEEQAVVASIAAPVADVWLGGNDIDAEMTWVWVTAEAMVYEGWRVGEPNDSNGEDCMIMEVDVGGTWDDRGCADLYGYYCER
jgi:hypothetical protein